MSDRMSAAERALTSARGAHATSAVRESVTEAMELPEGARESVLIEALDHAADALDAMMALLLDARDTDV